MSTEVIYGTESGIVVTVQPIGVPGPAGAPGGGGEGGISDGDKGDITVSSSGTVWTIDSSVISSFGRTLTDDADAATARSTLGLVIGTNVQAYDADLATWAGLTPSANAQSLVTAADYAAMRGLLDLEAGTDFLSPSAIAAAYQPLDSELTSLAGASANGVSLVTAANYAAMRALLDLEAGTDFYSVSGANAAFQPLDSDLTAIAALTTNAAGRSILTLSDPNADRIAFWDDSAGAYAHLEVGSGLSLSGTTLTASGSSGVSYSTLSAARTLSNTTAFQAIFESSHDEIAVEASTTYEVSGLLYLTGMSSTSGNADFSLLGSGTATLTGSRLHFWGGDTAYDTPAVRHGRLSESTGATSGNALVAAAATQMVLQIYGKVRVDAAGTIIPSLALTTAIGTAEVNVESFIILRKLGPTATISVGAS